MIKFLKTVWLKYTVCKLKEKIKHWGKRLVLMRQFMNFSNIEKTLKPGKEKKTDFIENETKEIKSSQKKKWKMSYEKMFKFVYTLREM